MNIVQQSIAKARRKMHEANRLVAVAVKQIKKDRERSNANLELLLDQIVAETGIELKPENMPTVMVYVQQFLKDQQQSQPDDDGDGMKDFPV
jgi:anion-transporting  ArsA/GET3 family ATPase